MRYRFSLAQLLLTLLILSEPSSAANRLYMLTDLGDLPENGDESRGRAINLLGQATGYANTYPDLRGFLWTPATANASTGTLNGLGAFPSETRYSLAVKINNYGQIVGMNNTHDGLRAFLWTPTSANGVTGSMVLPLGGAATSEAHGINSRGQVVGNIGAHPNPWSFVWTPANNNGTTGSMINLGSQPTGSDYSTAYDINDYGQVVGYTSGANGQHPYLWTPTAPGGTTGSISTLGIAPNIPARMFALAINGPGQVVGYSGSAAAENAFIWTPNIVNGSTGSIIDLGASAGPGVATYAWDVNDVGEVVGSKILAGNSSAFLWTISEGMQNLNLLLDSSSGSKWTLEDAHGINEVGQIVGIGRYDADGPGGTPALMHAFLLTPIPEPGATGLLILVSVMPLWRRRS